MSNLEKKKLCSVQSGTAVINFGQVDCNSTMEIENAADSKSVEVSAQENKVAVETENVEEKNKVGMYDEKKQHFSPRPQRKLKINRRFSYLNEFPVTSLLPKQTTELQSAANSSKSSSKPGQIVSLKSSNIMSGNSTANTSRSSNIIRLRPPAAASSVANTSKLDSGNSNGAMLSSSTDPPPKKKRKLVTWP